MKGRSLQDHVIDFPCKSEKALSLKCLSENEYNRDMCNQAFTNFKLCQLFWKKISTLRMRSNITPAMPPPDEREEILKNFKSTGALPDYSRSKP